MQQAHEHEKNGRPYSDDKGFSIVVNGRERTVEAEELTFHQVIALAFDDPPTGEFVGFLITYRGAGGRKPDGTLTEGASVKVKNGTIFNVTVTDKS